MKNLLLFWCSLSLLALGSPIDAARAAGIPPFGVPNLNVQAGWPVAPNPDDARSFVMSGSQDEHSARQQTGMPLLGSALNPNGTVRAGAHGSFDVRGYTMHTAPDGHPVFASTAAQETLGAGDANWSDAFQTNGPNGDVFAVLVDGQGNTYVGGKFSAVGGIVVNNVAKWNGTTWSALGAGVDDKVYALAMDQANNLYAAGKFTKAGGTTAYGVAKWNGSAWAALGDGTNGWVYTLALDKAGNVYAGGLFTTAGSVKVNYVAKWDGTAWSALGTGMNGSGVLVFVRTLAIDGTGAVYAGGIFNSAGGLPAANIAKWNGTAWAALNTGIDKIGGGGGVNALALDGAGNVYAGGYFDTAGGVPATNVAKWNGVAWSAVGNGLGAGSTTATVAALTLDGAGNLYAGGSFLVAIGTGTTSSNIAKWDGKSWAALGTGTNKDVYALTATTAGCYAGGAFTATGDNSKGMLYVGYYTNTVVTATSAAQPSIGISLYPNPTHSTVTVQLPAIPGAVQAMLTLVDALGRVVRTQRVALPSTGAAAELSLVGMRPGLYHVQLRTGSGQVSRELVIE